ncbi:hypothetical protein LI328DRAFT_158652 [Trichoderma asperelloides]|nr:hypothetical protein LI328DRAFT_158652 [Trichoderma asperelloides]
MKEKKEEEEEENKKKKEKEKKKLQTIGRCRCCPALSKRLARSIMNRGCLVPGSEQRPGPRPGPGSGSEPGRPNFKAPRPLPSPLFLRCSCTSDVKSLRWTHKVGVAGMGNWLGLDGGAQVAQPAAHASAGGAVVCLAGRRLGSTMGDCPR